MTPARLLLVAALLLPAPWLVHAGTAYGEIAAPDRTLLAQDPGGSPTGPATPSQWPSPPPMLIDPSKMYTAVIATTLGDMEVAILAAETPITVNNVVFLAR